MAEASLDQARQAFEKFLAGAQATAGTIEERGATVRAGAKDISSKAIAYAEKNVQASLNYAESLLKAKDLTEVMRLHSEYVQAQMRALAEQASEMGQIGQPRRDGCGQAEILTFAPESGVIWLNLPKSWASGLQTLVRKADAASQLNCVALHKIDMIWMFYWSRPTKGTPVFK